MDEAKSLVTIFDILDNYWEKLTSELSEEQLTYLKTELSDLESSLESSKNIEEINKAVKNFFQTFSKLEALEYLANVDRTQIRSGSLPEVEEEIKIKIINYCVTLQDRIHMKKSKKAHQLKNPVG